jgi:hypothetical protein
MKKIINCILIFSLLALTSCSLMYQKGYFVTPPNVNCFHEEKEKNIKASIFLNHYELQSNVALSKHAGLSASFNGGFRGQYGAELGGIYYNIINHRNYFELQGGYGYYSNYIKVPYKTLTPLSGERGTYFTNKSETRYHKIFVQFFNLGKSKHRHCPESKCQLF